MPDSAAQLSWSSASSPTLLFHLSSPWPMGWSSHHGAPCPKCAPNSLHLSQLQHLTAIKSCFPAHYLSLAPELSTSRKSTGCHLDVNLAFPLAIKLPAQWFSLSYLKTRKQKEQTSTNRCGLFIDFNVTMLLKLGQSRFAKNMRSCHVFVQHISERMWAPFWALNE